MDQHKRLLNKYERNFFEQNTNCNRLTEWKKKIKEKTKQNDNHITKSIINNNDK